MKLVGSRSTSNNRQKRCKQNAGKGISNSQCDFGNKCGPIHRLLPTDNTSFYSSDRNTDWSGRCQFTKCLSHRTCCASITLSKYCDRKRHICIRTNQCSNTVRWYGKRSRPHGKRAGHGSIDSGYILQCNVYIICQGIPNKRPNSNIVSNGG